MTEKLLSRDEVAQMFGICKMTVLRREAAGLLHPIRLGRRIYRYRMQDIESYLNSNKLIRNRGGAA